MRRDRVRGRHRHAGKSPAVAAAFLVFAAPTARAGCKIETMVELPVTLTGMSPVIMAKINGADAKFILDSGSSLSVMSDATAAEYRLRRAPAPANAHLYAVGGAVSPMVATVNELTIAGFVIHNFQFAVGGGSPGSGAAGLIGQNLLRVGDVEYDLAQGMIRLMRTDGCEHTRLAYWSKPEDSYSLLDIKTGTLAAPRTEGIAYLNGEKLHVLFDTGANRSMLSLRAAAGAGLTPTSAGVEPSGRSRGLGKALVQTYVGRFQSFKIGEEEIRNAHLRFGDIGLGPDVDMLLGEDFFLSHRIFVAHRDQRLFFTYNGGPVFDLKPTQPAD